MEDRRSPGDRFLTDFPCLTYFKTSAGMPLSVFFFSTGYSVYRVSTGMLKDGENISRQKYVRCHRRGLAMALVFFKCHKYSQPSGRPPLRHGLVFNLVNVQFRFTELAFFGAKWTHEMQAGSFWSNSRGLLYVYMVDLYQRAAAVIIKMVLCSFHLPSLIHNALLANILSKHLVLFIFTLR